MMNIAGVEDKKDAVGFHLVGFTSAEKITRRLVVEEIALHHRRRQTGARRSKDSCARARTTAR